jgi:Opioid growth factor receptor (OGFr) conserved region
MKTPSTIASPLNNIPQLEVQKSLEIMDQNDIPVSASASQPDAETRTVTRPIEDKVNSEGPQTNGTNSVADKRLAKETDETEMEEVPPIAAESQGDKLPSGRKRITFPTRQDGTTEEDSHSAIPSTSKDHPEVSKPEEMTEPEVAEEDPAMLPDPEIVRHYDFSPRAVQEFLLNYPDARENRSSTVNLRFFNNEFPFRPRGVGIDEFHVVAKGRFRLLEQHHGYHSSPLYH